MSATRDLCEFSANLGLDAVPAEVSFRARLLMLDCIGIIIRARSASESTPALLASISSIGLNAGTARVFADRKTYAPAGAVLLNSTLAHSLDFDDTHAAAIVHAGATVIPAALGAAELVGASGSTVLAAIIAGYEVALRLALALPAGDHYDRGFHPSATCGVFGAAIAAARVLGLDSQTTESAMGIALSQTAGSLQFLANGAWTKRFQVGWSSTAGFVAAVLASNGYKGASDAVEGRHGFLTSYAPAPNAARASAGLGATWELMQVGVKPYPSCRWGHAGIDAALNLREQHELQVEEIESAVLGISRAGMLLVGSPAEQKSQPDNIVAAQFSGPFVIATALRTGRMDWRSYEDLSDPKLRSLMQRIRCEEDQEIQAHFPENMSGKLTIHARGRAYTKVVITPKGEPQNFLSEPEFLAKFQGLAEPLLGKLETETLAARILSFDISPEAADLFTRLDD